MNMVAFITFAIPVYIALLLILRIILGLIHYEKNTFIILGLLLLSFGISPIRESIFSKPATIFFILGLPIIVESLYLIIDTLIFKMKKKQGFYNQITSTVTEIERRLEFVKYNFIFLGIYYFPHVSYQSNYFDTDYYSIKNGFKKDIYKINDTIILYKDPSTGDIIEENEKNNNFSLALKLLLMGGYFLLLAIGTMNRV